MLDELGSVQWPCNEKAPARHADHAYRRLRARQGQVHPHRICGDRREDRPALPAAAHHRPHPVSQYNVGAQTRRTDNVVWHEEDRLEIHPHDAENRGIRDGDWVRLPSRAGETTLRALITDRVAPGVVYTTFHHPDTQANVITTDFSDWATNCPEYKVTAVQVGAVQRPDRLAERIRRAGAAEPAHRRPAGGGGVDRA